MTPLDSRSQARVLAQHIAQAEPERLAALEAIQLPLSRILHPLPAGTALVVRDALIAMMVGDALPLTFRRALVEPLTEALLALTAETTPGAEGTGLHVVGEAG